MKELGLDHQSSESQPSPLSTSLLSLTNLDCLSLIVLQAFAHSILSTWRVSLSLILPSRLKSILSLLEIIPDSPDFRVSLSVGLLWRCSIRDLLDPGCCVVSNEHILLYVPCSTLCPAGALTVAGEHGSAVECDGDSHSGSYRPHPTFLILSVCIISLSCIPAFVCSMC